MTSVDSTRLLSSARSLAAAGAWSDLIALVAESGDPGQRAGELDLLHGEALTRSGEERRACEVLRVAIPKLADDPDPGLHRRAINLMGVASFATGELGEADAAFQRARELATDADDLLLQARTSNNLGTIANLQGQGDSALSHYRVALATYQRLGQNRGLAETYHNLAITCRDLGELEQADEHELRALEYASHGAAPRVAAMARIGRAEVALRRGDAPFAEMTAILAADELSALGDPLNESDARRLVGAARVKQGRSREALESFASALSLAQSRGHALNQAEILRDRAEAWLQQGDRAKARDDAQAALALFSSLGAQREVALLERRLPALG